MSLPFSCLVNPNREEMARRFFRLRSLEAIETSYKSLLERNKQDRARLQKERDEAVTAATRAADELAKVRPGQSSQLYEDAMRFIAEGKPDRALEVLGEVALQRQSQTAKERHEQAQKYLEEATRAWLLRAHLLTTQRRFADAEKAYSEAVST